MGTVDLHFDNLVAADAVFGRRRHALFAQPQFLAGLRPRRNLEHAAAVNGRHFDLRSRAPLLQRVTGTVM
jgi:hypothetical protein